MSPRQPGTVSATLSAIIIVFSLNDVASLEHTRYMGMLKYIGALERKGSEKSGAQGMVGKGRLQLEAEGG